MNSARLLNRGARLGPLARRAISLRARLYRLTGGRFLEEQQPVVLLERLGSP